ncbi:carbohydrate binding family 9 domain-containing protein [bacterium]|nr:carbohydrate binding family 9 domain-containing protein [bacterium]
MNGAKPVLDGRVDDPAWHHVAWSGEFVQRMPEDGAAPAAQTEFKILYDDQALYFGFRMHDDPSLVRSLLARRDWFPGDWIEVNIDSYHDQRTAFSFTLSLSGTRGDEFVSNDGNNWDGSWDPVWEGATRIDEGGWTAEMRIPLSQLRFDGAEEQVWGLQVQRRIFREEERSTWQQIPRDVSGWVSNFGEIHGIRSIEPARRIEIMPYSVARTETFAKIEGDPYRDGNASDVDIGMDGKIGLSSDLTLDFTINPDFGQIEADPSEVNLTAFETYFSEKRPFFIEGANILDLPLAPAITGGHFTRDRLFYSRRIGKRPAHSPDLDDDEYAKAPGNTSILGAAKLTGKTADGLSICILESATALERAAVTGPAGESETAVEPGTNYFVGRAMQDFRDGDTVIGAMITAVNRDIEDPQLEFLRRSAYAGGVDLQHCFHDRDFRLEARFFGSRLRGTAESIDAAQTASARYFQRPDNDHTDYDPTRTTLGGSAGSLLLTRTGNNSSLMFQTGAAFRSPGFEINDIGYMRRADEINQSTWVGYTRRNPFSIFNYWQLNGNQWLNWDWGGNFLGAAVNMNSSWEFRNRWGGYWGVSRTFAQTSNTALRGGPSMELPGDTEASFNLWSDSSKDVRSSLGGWFDKGDASYFDVWNGWISLAARPSNALQISLNPGFTRNLHDMQYVDTVSHDGEDRYLFGHVDQRTFSLTFRLDYCVTPNLTVQYYGSPFVSSGSFGAFKRITDPRADAYADRSHAFGSGEIAYDTVDAVYEVDENGDGAADYEIGDPDFNFRDFNSNLVVRWEYEPGSTLFVVWSQSRSDFLSSGASDLGNDLDGLFRVHPHDVFLLKFNRWFSL